MSKIDTSVVWGPRVLGREKLDARRCAFTVEAPFDMGPEQIASLIGMIVSVDGATWTIRGVVPNIPDDLIRTGQPVEILVVGT